LEWVREEKKMPDEGREPQVYKQRRVKKGFVKRRYWQIGPHVANKESDAACDLSEATREPLPFVSALYSDEFTGR
jgi:hypothetical protein